jgi:hypothetical protein
VYVHGREIVISQSHGCPSTMVLMGGSLSKLEFLSDLSCLRLRSTSRLQEIKGKDKE